jgi:UDP-N-acetyl-D-glucosamine dehydrogenase
LECNVLPSPRLCKVTGFDTDPGKVASLNAGKSYIEHIPQTKIQQFVNSRHFSATTDFARLKEADAILICVPTPPLRAKFASSRTS